MNLNSSGTMESGTLKSSKKSVLNFVAPETIFLRLSNNPVCGKATIKGTSGRDQKSPQNWINLILTQRLCTGALVTRIPIHEDGWFYCIFVTYMSYRVSGARTCSEY